MSAAAYATDLATISLADATTGWAELTGHTGGGAPAAETDYFIHNSTCVSQSTGTQTGTGAGLQFDYGSNITWTTGFCVFAWQIFLAGNAVATWANGGMRIGVGSTTGNIKFWNAVGSDTGRAPYGGWQNTAIDPTYTADATEGTPAAGSYRIFGSMPNITAAVTKGNPHGVDAMRYGRGKITITLGDLANGYGTFAGMAAANDALTARWGLFQAQGGSYLWKGLLSIGSAATAVDFRDANRAIFIDNTPRTYAAFNRIEIYNASSRVDWNAITLTALGTLAKGELEVMANADVNFDNCTFTDMSTFIFQSASTVNGSVFRRCGQVTLGGATMAGCLFDNSTAAIALACASSVSGLSNTTFISDGTGHALEITSGTSHTLNSLTFTGYAATSGSTGNEAVFVNISSGSVTIYAGSTFSYKTAGATVTIIAGSVSATLTVVNAAGSPIASAIAMVAAANATGSLPYQVTVTIANSGTTATVTHTAHGMLTNDKVLIKGASLPANNGVFTITKISDNSYSYTMGSTPGSSPTGAIKATWVALSGITDANGQITMNRVFSTNQPVSGWARKSSSAPYYKTGSITGTISTSTGATLSCVLIADQ